MTKIIAGKNFFHASHKPWTLPGGHLEDNETFQEALIREAREELGIQIEFIGKISPTSDEAARPLPLPIRVHVVEYTNEKGTHKKYEEFFLVRMISGEISLQESEIVSHRWFTREEIEGLADIYACIREIIVEVVK